jgi:hypothetical protein
MSTESVSETDNFDLYRARKLCKGTHKTLDDVIPVTMMADDLEVILEM